MDALAEREVAPNALFQQENHTSREKCCAAGARGSLTGRFSHSWRLCLDFQMSRYTILASHLLSPKTGADLPAAEEGGIALALPAPRRLELQNGREMWLL